MYKIQSYVITFIFPAGNFMDLLKIIDKSLCRLLISWSLSFGDLDVGSTHTDLLAVTPCLDQYTQIHPNQKCGMMKAWQCCTSSLIQNIHMNFGRINLSIIELNTNQRSNCFV